MTTIGKVLTKATAALSDAAVDNARLEARLLLAHSLALSPAQVFGRADQDLQDDQVAAFGKILTQRCAGAPLAHITGRREFWSLEFKVSPATLIPRPDTETLIELAVEIYELNVPPKTILDLGTGSGCILLALLSCFPGAAGTGVDDSAEACEVARENARALGYEERCRIINAPWSDGISGEYDLIVSNPPYIPSNDINGLQTDVREHEPMGALDGGPDGLDAYREILPLAKKSLSHEGILIVEFGIGQAREVAQLAVSAGLQPGTVRSDLGGIERVSSFYKKSIGIAEATG